MTTDKPPSRLEDARLLKRAGLPLATPVEHREFSQAYTKQWVALMDAHSAFMAALLEYCNGDQSPARWQQVARRLVALHNATARAVDFVEALNGRLASGQDQHEYALLLTSIVERALPFIDYWADVIDAVEAGASLAIRPGDIPRWIDEEPG